jgi:hypothetical protein
MAVTATPIFVQVPNVGQARPGAANTASDGSGVLTTLFTAGSNGSRVDYITIVNSQATAAASSAMSCKIFVTDISGANPRLRSEVLLAAATRSNTVVGASGTITFPGGLLLKSGQLLKCVQTVYAGAQDLVDFTAHGGDY